MGINTEILTTAEKGGTAMKALMKSLVKMGGGNVPGDEDEGEVVPEDVLEFRKSMAPKLQFKGKNLLGMLHQIKELNLPESDTMKLFGGRQESWMAYRNILKQEGKYSQGVKDIGEAASNDTVGKMLTANEGNPQLTSAQDLRVETARLEESEKSFGNVKNQSAAAWHATRRG